jgi:hypothetical protein
VIRALSPPEVQPVHSQRSDEAGSGVTLFGVQVWVGVRCVPCQNQVRRHQLAPTGSERLDSACLLAAVAWPHCTSAEELAHTRPGIHSVAVVVVEGVLVSALWWYPRQAKRSLVGKQVVWGDVMCRGLSYLVGMAPEAACLLPPLPSAPLALAAMLLGLRHNQVVLVEAQR